MVMRIGYLVPEFPGQTHTFFWREIKALERRGVEVDIVSSRKPRTMPQPHSWTAEAEARTQYLYPPKSVADLLLPTLSRATRFGRCARAFLGADGATLKQRLRLLPLVCAGAKLAQIAQQRDWTHLHCHMCSDVANIALFANLLADLPYSLTLHASLSEFGPNQKAKWRHAKFGIAITRLLESEIRSTLASDAPKQIAIASMGVDSDSFTRESPYQPWVAGQPARLFSCGRLNPCKGHAEVIEAVSQLVTEGRPVSLRIAGEDELGGRGYRKVLQEKIKQLSLEDHVELLGAIGEKEVKQELESSHLFVLGSYGEPFGVATAEAMAMQTPVITTAAGGAVELIRNDIDGILVPPRSAEQLATSIAQLLDNPEKAVKLGLSARERVESEFTSQNSADTLINCISPNQKTTESTQSPKVTETYKAQETTDAKSSYDLLVESH